MSIISMDEYNKLYNFNKNTYTGCCSKNTVWCFTNGYNTPYFGHLYNKESFQCCNDNLLYLFKNLVDASEKYNFKFFLDYGTLLGCLRNEKKIPYDADIDIGIYIGELNNFVKSIEFLQKNGEIVIFKRKGLIIYQLSSINDIHIDLFVYNKIQKNEKNLYIGEKYLQNNNSYFVEEELLPLKKAKFENFDVLIPNNSKVYLERSYGKHCIEYPITKHSYIDNYPKTGTKGDLPDINKWNTLITK